MPGREKVVERICELAGNSVARVADPGDGWPSLVEVEVGGTWQRIAVFGAPVGPSHRNRDDVERRFQNPGSRRPMNVPAGHTALFLALWESDARVPVDHPVLVSANVAGRSSNLTRFSVFPKVIELQSAAAQGWADSYTTSDEHLTYFWPELLPVLVDATLQDVTLPGSSMAVGAVASGLADQAEAGTPVARLRRLGRSLVRDARFSRDVLTAYDHVCAMCGLGLGLIEAAHIWPVSAPGAPDTVTNGLALCRNHHGAFDRSLLWVNPANLTVTVHPSVLVKANNNAAAAAFVTSSVGPLVRPGPGQAPDKEMFLRRYEFMADSYEWVG